MASSTFALRLIWWGTGRLHGVEMLWHLPGECCFRLVKTSPEASSSTLALPSQPVVLLCPWQFLTLLKAMKNILGDLSAADWQGRSNHERQKRAFCEQRSYKLALSGPIRLLVSVAAAGPTLRALNWGLHKLLCAFRAFISIVIN